MIFRFLVAAVLCCLFNSMMTGVSAASVPKKKKFDGPDFDYQFCKIRAREEYQWLRYTKCSSLSGSQARECKRSYKPLKKQLKTACKTYKYSYNMYISRQTPVEIINTSPADITGGFQDGGRIPVDYAETGNEFFKVNYVDQPITGYRSGYKWKINKWVGPYTVEYNGATYEMAGWHFHKPSEHTFTDVGSTTPTESAMEIHFVHVMISNPYDGVQIDGDKYLVLGFMLDDFSVGGSAPCTGVFDDAINLANSAPGDEVTFTITDNMISRIFTYEGGLTTPPFTARVRWMLSAYRIQASEAALNSWPCDIDESAGIGAGILSDYKDVVTINEGNCNPNLNCWEKLKWKQFGHYPLSTRTAWPDRPAVRTLYQDILLATLDPTTAGEISNGCPI